MDDDGEKPDTQEQAAPTKRRRIRWLPISAFLVVGALVTATILALLMNIFQKKQEAAQPWFRVAEQNEQTHDPAVWGQNFPLQYKGWQDTAQWPDADKVKQAPTEADPRDWKAPSKLQADPRLVTMWQGYAFSVEYNEPRGHAYMLTDQRYVKRVTQFKQPGTCLNCHASMPEVYEKLGNGDKQKGFEALGTKAYADVTKLANHPVGCIDCHDPKSMALRVTRPAFADGIKKAKAAQGIKDYDVNRDATPQEMRAYVCAQCHVEYHFKGENKVLTYPWDKGLTVEAALAVYDEQGFTDFKHAMTGANIVKAQHPDFETWSNGIHAKAGVTCADCHMAYKRDGSTKYSDHQVRSPMVDDATINRTCLTCHHETEQEMKSRVEDIHSRYEHSKDVAFDALTALINDLDKAKKDGTVPPERIQLAQNYQRKAQFFMDYVVSENSRGFHAPAYTQRILVDVTDASRGGQLALLGQDVSKIRTKPAQPITPPAPPTPKP